MKSGHERVRSSPAHVHRARALATLALLLLILAPSVAPAHPEVALEYDRGAQAESCSSAEQLRAAVAARLGYDPFASSKVVDKIVVRIHRVGAGLEGTIERREPSGNARGKSVTIVSKTGDCAELVAALAVSIAIAVDPLSITREPDVAPPPPPPPPATAPPAAPPPAQPAAPATAPSSAAEPLEPMKVVVGAGLSIAVDALPKVSLGPRLVAGIARGLWEVDVEGRFDAPVSAPTQGGSIEASLVLGTLAPCMHYSLAIACAEVSLGALRGTGLGFDHTREANTFYMAAGARGGAEIPLGSRFALRVLIEGEVPLRPTRLEAGGQPVWSTPPVQFAAVPTLVGRFP